MIHSNLPKRAWGWAARLACEVINRNPESAVSNKRTATPETWSRLERWYGRALPGQTRALNPLGCLCFKHIPAELRNKMQMHATPMVYLGVDPDTRAYLLGTLYDLRTSTAVEVIFLEDVFPFRKLQSRESPASLIWEGESDGDIRAGMFPTEFGDLQERDDFSSLSEIILAGDKNKTDELSALGGDEKKTDEIVILEPENVMRQPEESPRVISAAPAPTEAEPQTLRRSSRPVKERKMNTASYRDTSAPDSTLVLQGEGNIVLQMVTEADLEHHCPRNAYEALRSPLKAKWLLAMNREKDCHTKNKTFGDVMPENCSLKPVPTDWVFKIKHRGGAVDLASLDNKQFKARVVVRGQFMKCGINFNDTFAPVAKQPTVRALLAFAAKNDLELLAGDVETAFLTSDMDCELYVKMPPFWAEPEEKISEKNASTRPRLLVKGVPGIPQGSRLFYETMKAHLALSNYRPSQPDCCLFVHESIPETFILLWVDDFILAYKDAAVCEDFLRHVRSKFTITVSPLRTFLGMVIRRDRKRRLLFVSQEATVDVLLARAGMSDCNSTTLPCTPGMVFSKRDAPEESASNPSTEQFRSLIALANFICCWTRPDIAFIVNKLCKFMSNPGQIHVAALKHLLRYLKGTKTAGLRFNFGGKAFMNCLHAFADASFADCRDTGRSTVGYVFFYSGAVLSWHSKLHSLVTTSTNHSEYAAMALATKEAEWLRLLFGVLEGKELTEPTPVFVDNAGIVALANNPVEHSSNKHITVLCCYVRERVAQGIVTPLRISSQENVADIFTRRCLHNPSENVQRLSSGLKKPRQS